MPGFRAYVTSKHAVVGLMRRGARVRAAQDSRQHGQPRADRDAHDAFPRDGFVPGQGEQAKRQILTGIPMGRYGTPEEVADLMLFLASDESRYLTGGVYMVDGGTPRCERHLPQSVLGGF